MSLFLNGFRSVSGRFGSVPRSSAAIRLATLSARAFSDQKSTQTPPAAEVQPTTVEEPSTPRPTDAVRLSGFAQAFERHSQPAPELPVEPPKSFATLLRNSKFIDLGDSENKIVNGKIFHIVEDDLYIDFGWKFHCVCTRPTKSASEYVRGAKVRLRIKDLELSTRFLGSDKDLTILEADCQIVGLVSSPARVSNRPSASA